MYLKLAGLISLTMLAACAPTGGGRSGSADCFTTDDGPYDCQVKTTDAAGSFVITAPGKPTYTMNISARELPMALSSLRAEIHRCRGNSARSAAMRDAGEMTRRKQRFVPDRTIVLRPFRPRARPE